MSLQGEQVIAEWRDRVDRYQDQEVYLTYPKPLAVRKKNAILYSARRALAAWLKVPEDRSGLEICFRSSSIVFQRSVVCFYDWNVERICWKQPHFGGVMLDGVAPTAAALDELMDRDWQERRRNFRS